MYRETTQTYHSVSNPRYAGVRKKNKEKDSQEKLRLAQLLVCLILFLAVFIGKGIFPNKLIQVRDNILTLITSNTDFRAAFSSLGDALPEDSLLNRLEDFCVEVFGADSGNQQEESSQQGVPELASILSTEHSFLSGNPSEQVITDHLLSQNGWKLSMEPSSEAVQAELEVNTASEPEPETVPAAGTLILKSDYSGQALPDNYTMDQLSLGDLETQVPVLGYINSEYGYRDHPISGAYQFHGGVDISGSMGDPIHAFAAGTVEYVGEDDSYGLYLQLDHGNGVKSFYAHCSAVCVQKEQSVALGETIAQVGSSGMSTGPHLHLELKYNKMHLNPIYYIEYLSDQ